ncbi:MAG: ABC transporter permease, partial [Chthoniobacterales bacterium]|nr:ABC transporter permease [Chthoniobacterales bacterium]
GASPARVVLRHSLRGGLIPVVSYLGPTVAGLLTGSFVVETIFQIPGLGRYFVTAAFNRDYTMVVGTVLFYAGFIIVFNLLVDLILIRMNPKLRYE